MPVYGVPSVFKNTLSSADESTIGPVYTDPSANKYTSGGVETVLLVDVVVEIAVFGAVDVVVIEAVGFIVVEAVVAGAVDVVVAGANDVVAEDVIAD